MCLLIATTGTNRPSKKALRRAAKNNPDGFGFAVIGDGRIYTYRSMDIEDTIKSYFDVRDEFPDSNSLFHLRITTHGATNISNCHPFRVNDDVVMGHNGTLPIKEENGKSDTRIFAEEWLPQFDLRELLDTQEGVTELETFAGSSKLAFLNTSSDLRDSLYIINEKYGHWDGGIWYSNGSYKKSYGSFVFINTTSSTYKINDRRAYTPRDTYSFNDPYYNPLDDDYVWDYEKGEWVDEDEFDDAHIVYWTCSSCGAKEIIDLNEDEASHCYECGTCWYCEKPWSECACEINDFASF